MTAARDSETATTLNFDKKPEPPSALDITLAYHERFEYFGISMLAVVQLVEGYDLKIMAQEKNSGSWETMMSRRFTGEGTIKDVRVWSNDFLYARNEDLRIKIVDADGDTWHAAVQGSRAY